MRVKRWRDRFQLVRLSLFGDWNLARALTYPIAASELERFKSIEHERQAMGSLSHGRADSFIFTRACATSTNTPLEPPPLPLRSPAQTPERQYFVSRSPTANVLLVPSVISPNAILLFP